MNDKELEETYKDASHLKHRLPEIKTLAMLKMEKNFIAYCEKKYPRQPYADPKQPIHFLIYRLKQEVGELIRGYGNSLTESDNLDIKTILNLKEECADISNLVDYLFEKLVRKEQAIQFAINEKACLKTNIKA